MDDWAVVVGIAHDPGRGLKPLQGPVTDAEDFAAWLSDPLGGGIVDLNRIKRTTSDDFPKAKSFPRARPNQGDVQPLFDEVRDEVTVCPGGMGRRLWVDSPATAAPP